MERGDLSDTLLRTLSLLRSERTPEDFAATVEQVRFYLEGFANSDEPRAAGFARKMLAELELFVDAKRH